jgi:outer membrane protein assembly factor BamB
LVSSSDEGIYLVDRETGALLWRYDPGYQLNGVTAGLTVVGRQILALTNAGTLLSFVAPAPPPTVLETEGDRSWDGRSLFRPR